MRQLVSALSVVMGFSSVTAQAEDLKTVADSRRDSLSGALLQRAQARVTARRHVRSDLSVATRVERLAALGRLGALARIGRARWLAEHHPHLQRVVVRREAEASKPAQTGDAYLASIRAQQGKVSKAKLLETARALAGQLHDELGFSAEETFVPVQTGQGMLVLVNNQTGERETLIERHRIVYQRRVNGIPVVGRAGEFQVILDAEGDVEELEIPTDDYRLTGELLAQLSPEEALQRVSRTSGLAARPRGLDKRLQKRGAEVVLREFQCGLFEAAEGDELKRGCYLMFHDNGLKEELVSAD